MIRRQITLQLFERQFLFLKVIPIIILGFDPCYENGVKDGREAGCDIAIDTRQDLACCRDGNLAVEVRCRGKPYRNTSCQA